MEEFRANPLLLSVTLILLVVSLQGLILAFLLWRAERQLRVMSESFNRTLLRIEPLLRVVKNSLGGFESKLSSLGGLEESIRKNSSQVLKMVEQVANQASQGLDQGKALLGGLDQSLDQGFRLYSQQLEQVQLAVARPLRNITPILKNATSTIRRFFSGDRNKDTPTLTRKPGEEGFV